MHTHYGSRESFGIYKQKFFVLLFCSFAGLIAGISLNLLDRSDHYWLQFFVGSDISFFSIGLSMIFQILLAFSCFWGKVWFLFYPLVLFEAICCGYCGMMVTQVLGSGAWLARPLFMLSGNLVSVLTWFFVIRYCNGKQCCILGDVLFVSVVLLITLLLNAFIISPFLNDLLQYM